MRTYPDAVEALRRWRDAGLRTAMVSASRNAATVLAAAELEHLFDTRVDGVTAAERGLPGKPAPDTFLEAARALGVAPERCMVIEDAVAGVRAGAAGSFGLVVGVSRDGDDEALSRAGAHRIVHALSELPERPVCARSSSGEGASVARSDGATLSH